MTISANTTPNDNLSGQTPDPINTQPGSQRPRFLLPASDWLILLGLTLVALIPRILLATQLDLVTDEIIYIMAGKIYLPLLLHFHIYSAQWTFNYEHPPLVK